MARRYSPQFESSYFRNTFQWINQLHGIYVLLCTAQACLSFWGSAWAGLPLMASQITQEVKRLPLQFQLEFGEVEKTHHRPGPETHVSSQLKCPDERSDELDESDADWAAVPVLAAVGQCPFFGLDFRILCFVLYSSEASLGILQHLSLYCTFYYILSLLLVIFSRVTR